MSSATALIQVHTGDQALDGLLSPDVYFRQGYGRAAGVAENGHWVLLEGFEGAWQVPLIVRTLDDGTRDAISPYGYSGVYSAPSLSSVQVQQAWSATVSLMKELGLISVLLRHSALVPQAADLPGLISVIQGHPTIVVEPVDRDSAWSGLAGTCRSRVRKALKNGYTGVMRQASSEDLASYGGFRRLYEQTMQRLGAAPLYFFSDEYYKELLEGMGSDLLIAEVRDAGGVQVSASLLLRHEQLLHYHLSGSDPEGARMGTNNLMLWTATKFTAEQGLRQLHLGGGRSGHDSLFHFKRGFGGRTLGYDVSGLIIDEEAYQSNVTSRAKECDTTPEELLASNFFPAYRGGTNEGGE